MKKPFWDVDLYMVGEDGEYYTVMRVFFFFLGGGRGWDFNKMRMEAVGSVMRLQDTE